MVKYFAIINISIGPTARILSPPSQLYKNISTNMVKWFHIQFCDSILCKEISLQLTNQFQVFRQKTFIIDDHLLIFTGPIQFSFRGFFLIYQIL